MYGLILDGIAEYVIKEFGEQKWADCCKKAKMNRTTFAIHDMYNEKEVLALLQACAQQLKIPAEKLTSAFGDYFVTYITPTGYGNMLGVLGRHLRDFLNGLDNLHEYLKFSYPRLKAPSFRLEGESEKGLTLHYRSKRKGYLHYVRGILLKVAQIFYQTEMDIEVVHAEEMSNSAKVVLRLVYDNSAFFKAQKDMGKRQRGTIRNLEVKSDFFLECFPFHLIFDRNMVIRHVGHSLANVMPQLNNARMESTFNLSRPIMDFKFANIVGFQNITFELTTIKDVGRKAAAGGGKGGKQSMKSAMSAMDEQDTGRMKLKGQMKFIKSWDAIIFLASPVMETLDRMFDLGVFITDMSMHDVSRDLILVGAQQSRELGELLEKEKGKGKKLEDAMKRLGELRKRGDELLYSMIPASVAARMRSGASTSDMCQAHESVTILFSDIPGFIAFTNKLKPMEVMSLLNTIFSGIDKLIERHKVYKVETVGDVYMVAAGAPEPNKDHSGAMTNLALDMVRFIGDVKDPSGDSEHCQVRIGMNSGPVVTGLVGLKMPRFCFFGDTVNTAARMQTNSVPMRIHVTEYYKYFVAGKPLNLTHRGTVSIKGKGEMNTYWLEGRSTDGRCVSPSNVTLPTLNIPSTDPAAVAAAAAAEAPAEAAAPAEAPAAE